MRCSAWSSLAISVCSALLLAAPAAAHVTVTPPFISFGSIQALTLTVPNERDEPMTDLDVTAPRGFVAVEALPSRGWRTQSAGRTAMWIGGSLASGTEALFTLELQAPKAGPVQLVVVQRYPGGEVVRWTVGLTVTPPEPIILTASSDGPNVVFFSLLAFLVLAAIAYAFWRRRRRSLQEK